MTRYAANMPSVGITSFLKLPIHEDFATVDADVGFLGIPYDAGNSWRPGTRFGPRDIRTYSARYSAWGGATPRGYWDINQQKRFLDGVRMVDCGDVDLAYYDIERNLEAITASVSAMLDRGVFPVMVGGDHSVTYPSIRAFERFGPLDIVQIDAHLDWIDEVAGIRYANGSPMRRAMEHDFTRNMAQLGIRDIRSREDDAATAEARGSQIVTRQTIREDGVAAVVDALPPLGNVYVTIDIDGLDPSIAPGTGSPTVDGLLYHEVRGLLQGIAGKANVVGFDVVEVNPMVDLNGQTSLLATTLILEFLGAIFDGREIAG
ncbi:MAG: agmatinase [Pseudomonadota bacterium]